MKKNRYFYGVASFMRKDATNTLAKVDFTVMMDNGSALFPLMKAIKTISEGYSKIAELSTIQFDNYVEISKEDYDAYNKLKKFITIKINKQRDEERESYKFCSQIFEKKIELDALQDECTEKEANFNNYIKEAGRLSTIKESAKDALVLLNVFKSNDIENTLTKIIKLCEA